MIHNDPMNMLHRNSQGSRYWVLRVKPDFSHPPPGGRWVSGLGVLSSTQIHKVLASGQGF